MKATYPAGRREALRGDAPHSIPLLGIVALSRAMLRAALQGDS